jgi:hypothetical protein
MAKVITTVLGKSRAAYRENEGGDMEKEELRRKLEEAEREIQRLQERRRENGFWTKKREITIGQEAALCIAATCYVMGLLFLYVDFSGEEHTALVRRNAVVYSVNYFRSSRVNVRCDDSSCQGRDNQGHYVILHCDSVRCWRVW